MLATGSTQVIQTNLGRRLVRSKEKNKKNMHKESNGLMRTSSIVRLDDIILIVIVKNSMNYVSDQH